MPEAESTIARTHRRARSRWTCSRVRTSSATIDRRYAASQPGFSGPDMYRLWELHKFVSFMCVGPGNSLSRFIGSHSEQDDRHAVSTRRADGAHEAAERS